MNDYVLVCETRDTYIYEANDGSHEIWIKKEKDNV